MRRWTLPGLLTLALGAGLLLLPLSYAADGKPDIRLRQRSLDLPRIPYAYAGPALPNHFDRRVLRRLDNAPRDNEMTDERAMLGRILFYDTRLSANDRMSCATCHRQKHAFADPRRFSRGIHGHRGRRNSMSLVNLRYQARGGFFWDERAPTLEAQALMPIEDPQEMAYDVGHLVDRLADDPTYAALFQYAFGSPDVTGDRIAKSLAQFVRSIASYRSKFDEGMQQVDSVAEDFPNFSRRENEGKRIFFGLEETARGPSCASCHVVNRGPGPRGRGGPGADRGQVALFLGRSSGNNGLDDEIGDDAGVGAITGRDDERGLFKIPTLRNIELTAPYMHDGRFRTLEQVVEHYRRGVQPHPNLDRRLGGRGREGRRGGRGLQVTVKQRNALISFLKTLTDEALVEDPRFSDPWR